MTTRPENGGQSRQQGYPFTVRQPFMILDTRLGQTTRAAFLVCGMISAAFAITTAIADDRAVESVAGIQKSRLPRENLLVYRGQDGARRPVLTTADWLQRRSEIVAGMQTVMGRLPGPEKRCALDVKVEGEVDCGSYVRQSITYSSEPGSRVPAYLLIPKKVLRDVGIKVPAVLCLHGTDNVVGNGIVVGLGSRPNRQYASELAERGYVALAPNYPLLAKYQPDLTALGWESGTLKAVWDNMPRARPAGITPIRQIGGFRCDRSFSGRAQLGLHGGF